MAALVVYLGVYLFMNFGAFAVVAFLRNAIRQRGRSPTTPAWCAARRAWPSAMAIILFSLVGLPPLAGFAAKFAIFAALFDARLLAPAGDRRPEHGAEPVLLPPRRAGDGARARARSGGPRRRSRSSRCPALYCAGAALALFVLFLWWGGLFNIGAVAAAAFGK